MDPIIIGALVGASLANAGALTATIILKRRATRARRAADKALTSAKQVASELVTGQMLIILDRFNLPTPGCPCEVCDERRLARAKAGIR